MDELCKHFSLERVGKSGAKFDFDKTRWFNQQYLRAKPKEELSKDLQVILKQNGIELKDNFVEKVCEQLKERATFVKDMWTEGKYYFVAPHLMIQKLFKKNGKKRNPYLII